MLRPAGLVLALLAWGGNAAAREPDSVRVRIEAGASSDLTNELFYEDAFVDTTFLGRRTVSLPEARYAGVLVTSIEGTRDGRATAYQVQNELSLGDKVSRGALAASLRSEVGPDLRLAMTPRFEYRHDRSFDRNLDELRGALGAKLRRELGAAETFLELGGLGEILRTRGRGADFLPDRQAGRASLALDHFALFGDEWRVGYGLSARAFPDSAVRDHFEHGWEASYRRELEGGHFVSLDADGARRVTRRPAPTSRDNFWSGRATTEAALRPDPRWSVRAILEGEALRYDLEDSTLYFNYQVVRVRLGPRFSGSASWSLALAPRGELLRSRVNPAEEYQEIGAVLELDLLRRGAWWNVAPAAGWRDYRDGVPDDVPLHSSYAFYELTLFGDQPLPGGLRFRTVGTARLEAHVDSAQDSRSLYFSFDLRYQF